METSLERHACAYPIAWIFGYDITNKFGPSDDVQVDDLLTPLSWLSSFFRTHLPGT